MMATATNISPNASGSIVTNSQYVSLLSQLKKIVVNLTCPQKIDLCKAWIQRFLQCEPNEEDARNFLIHCLTQQLLAFKDSELEYPFVSIANIKLPLQGIADELREHSLRPNVNTTTNCQLVRRRSKKNLSKLQISEEDCQFFDSDCVAKIQDLNRFITEITEINNNLTKELANTKRERDGLRNDNDQIKIEYDQLAARLHRTETISLDRYVSMPCMSCDSYKVQVEQISDEVQQLRQTIGLLRLEQNEAYAMNYQRISSALEVIEQNLLGDNPLEQLKSGTVISQILDKQPIPENMKLELRKREKRITNLLDRLLRPVKLDATPDACSYISDTLAKITKQQNRRCKRMQRKLLEQESRIANMQHGDRIKEKAHAIRYAALKSEIVLKNGATQGADLCNLIGTLDAHYRDFIDKNLKLDNSFVV